ncbi:hypothetical protein CERZMDRAFT_95743 [Cercospora zeae-maydis SCOH1-5]|uniref:Extracellular membrane protein CFEM domain-containing protein n=1 Tax=Cercospora zeae-maydis SCOH1-5 TaxID=717836 RepID=A0A6A6FLZ6_9PEZI|nr:hypothetical protein CERZMDRAFT_95743 [Cercospora zeae-maydis SCOH1-5]
MPSIRTCAVSLFLAAASATAIVPDHLPRQTNCLAQCQNATTSTDNPELCTSVPWINTFNACLSCAIPANIADTFIDPIKYLGSRCGYDVEFLSPDEENQSQTTEGKLHALPLPATTSSLFGDQKRGKISIPAIACGTIGAIVGLAALFILLLFLDRRRRKRQQWEEREYEEQQMKTVSEIFGFAMTPTPTPTRPHRSATTSTSDSQTLCDEKASIATTGRGEMGNLTEKNSAQISICAMEKKTG